MKMADEEEHGNTGILKLSRSCLRIGRWLTENAAAVKIAAEMEIYRVSPQKMPIFQNVSYISSNEICQEK